VPHRVVEVLRELAHVHGSEVVGGTRIDLPLSQDALASLVGAARESVNRAVRQLTAHGALRRAGRCYMLPHEHHLIGTGPS
jgi:CRP/FNR family cyclic AMP-dependent transcriptional regulator